MARTLAPSDKFLDVPVRVMNVRDEPQIIHAGAVVSHLEPTLVIETKPQKAQENRPSIKLNDGVSKSQYIPEYIQELVNGVNDATPESATLELQELLLRNRHVFSESEQDLGLTDFVEHHIDTGSAKPVRQPLRRFPPAHVQAISDHVDNMLSQGIIEPASSPWASNVVLVRKKDGTFRCCIDYRQLNNVTRKDAYPLQHIDSCLDAMAEAKWFSTIDLRSSYHQVRMTPEDMDKTAFICPRGMYRFRTMPFGLCNAGATFQRLMDVVMSGLHLEICLVYLDDIVVYAKSPYQHLRRLEMVFNRLSEAGLKLKPEKCKFFQKSVSFLGHVISSQGIGTDPEKIKAVVDWPVPTSVAEVRAFLGLAGYYRRFVRDFAKIASPLHALTNKNCKFHWSKEAEKSFNELKIALTTPPVLAMPNDSGEFILDTDASDQAIGAVLSQRQEGVERVVAYASRSLTRQERNYCVTRKELLAVVHFLKYFKQYLLGRSFKVRTDHAALTWLRRTPDPIGQQARWLEQMEEFNFIVEHRPGSRHSNADALSRRPCTKKVCLCKELTAAPFGGPADQSTSELRQTAGIQMRATQVQQEGASNAISLSWSLEGIRSEQQSDPDIGYIYQLIDCGAAKPMWDDVSPKSNVVKTLWSFWPRLSIREGLLKRRFESTDGRSEYWQIVLPKKLHAEFLSLVHGGMTGGHLALKKTKAAVQSRAYWPTWSSDVEMFIRRCSECARYHRGVPPRSTEMQTPLSGEPWERVSIDITGPHPKSSRQNQYILTAVDHFSKWAEAIAIPNHTATTVAKVLATHVFPRYGMPVQILSDRGPEFESELFTQLLKWLEIDKLRTTAYKPSTNGVVERFHRTLNSMLGKVVSESQQDWDERLPFVMAAYRASPHSSTGYSPNRLFLGRENRMPIDLLMGLPPREVNGNQSVHDFVANQQELADKAYQLVRQHLRVNAERRKVAYDARVKKKEFNTGDWVWYYYPRRFSRKSPKWQRCYTGPYLIVRDIPPANFVLQKTAKSTQFVVHADKLKKCFTPPVVNWLKDNVTDDTNESGASIVDHNRRNIETRIYDEVRHYRDSPCTTFHRLSSEDPESTSSTAIPTCDISTSKRSRRAPAFLNDYVITAIHVC